MPAAIPIFFLITDLDLGGAPLMLRSLAVGLKARGEFAPTVVSLAPPGRVSEMLQADGVPVFSLGATGPWQLSMVVARWVRLLRQQRPKLVMSVLIHANVVATLGQPFAPPAGYLQSIHTLQRKPAWHWGIQGLIAGQCDGIVVPSGAILQKIAENGFFSVGMVAPNGIDIERFHRAPLGPPGPGFSLPWPAWARVVGYVGRFDPVKRLPLLVEAVGYALRHNLPMAKDLHLALVGYGPQEGALKELSLHLGLKERVHFVGPTEQPENWYKSFAVMCLPSDAEGFGLTVIEALAAGRRVLAADIEPLRTIAHPALRLISDLAPASLALALQEVMNEPPLATGLAEQALAVLRARFSLAAMVNEYSKIFKVFSRG